MTAPGKSWLPFLRGGGGSVSKKRGETQESEEDDNSRHDDNGPGRTPEEEEARLLPYMPTLFSTDLPPCGPIPQVAYENVSKRLRTLWLRHAAADSLNISLLDICTRVKKDLEAELIISPPESELGTKARTPWGRENVFQYEIGWARYFAREAEVLEKKRTMSDAELEKLEFMDRLFPVPKELRLFLTNRPNKKGVLDLWRAWHHRKRGTTLNGAGQSSMGAGSPDGKNGEDAAGGEGEITLSSEDADFLVIHKPATKGEPEEHVQN